MYNGAIFTENLIVFPEAFKMNRTISDIPTVINTALIPICLSKSFKLSKTTKNIKRKSNINRDPSVNPKVSTKICLVINEESPLAINGSINTNRIINDLKRYFVTAKD